MKKDNYQLITEKLENTNIKLVVVSKYRPLEQLQALYDRGQRRFGENRVQEILEKHPALPDDIEWHFIGHLQTNKVKQIVPFVHLIHSIDSWRLLTEVNKQAEKVDRIIPVLLQFKIAQEESKYGLTLNDLKSFNPADYPNIRFSGVMGMASFVDDEFQVRREFSLLRDIFTVLNTDYFPDNEYFKEISMGMSGDYKLAIAEGSTMLRVGSLVF